MVPTFLTGQYTLHKSFDSPTDRSFARFCLKNRKFSPSAGRPSGIFLPCRYFYHTDNISPFAILSSQYCIYFYKKDNFSSTFSTCKKQKTLQTEITPLITCKRAYFVLYYMIYKWPCKNRACIFSIL